MSNIYKIKKDLMLREVGGSYVVVAVGKLSKEFKAVITLNESGAFLFKKLQWGITREDLIKELMNEYEIDNVTASNDVDKFIKKLADGKLFE